jgi:hypothetical protein
MKPLITALLLLMAGVTKNFAQSKVQYFTNAKNLQWGITLKGSVEFGFGKNAKATVIIHLVACWFIMVKNTPILI